MANSSSSRKRGLPAVVESEDHQNLTNKKGRFSGESKQIHNSVVTFSSESKEIHNSVVTFSSESKEIHNSVVTSNTLKFIPHTPPIDKEKEKSPERTTEGLADQGKPEDRLIPRRLFATTKEKVDGLKRELQPILLKQLKELSEILEIDPTYEVDLEMAAESMNLLKHLRSLNPDLEAVGEKAGEGAKMLLQGVKLVTRGRDLLRSAITDIPTSTE